MLKLIRFWLPPVVAGFLIAFAYLLAFAPSTLPFAIVKQGEQTNDEQPLSFAKAVQRASAAVVKIKSITVSRQANVLAKPVAYRELGSGIIMSNNGYVLTNYHVVNNAQQIVVELKDGRSFDAQLIGFDAPTDIALLKVDHDNLPVIPTQENAHSQVGDIVLAMGYPLELGQTITQGIISATDKTNIASHHARFLQMDAAVNNGNSGGALINTNGVLVGITSAKFRPQRNFTAQGIFFALPYSQAREVMDKIIQYGRVIRGYAGFNATPVDNGGREITNKLTPLFGIQITLLDPLGPAWQAGLELGDVITHIDGQKFNNYYGYMKQVNNTDPGKEIPFTIIRDGKQQLLNVKIAELRN